MSERNYFIPSLIIFIILLVICVVVYTRERKLSIFLILIPLLIVVLLGSPFSRKNPKIETGLFILAFLSGSIMYAMKLKNRR